MQGVAVILHITSSDAKCGGRYPHYTLMQGVAVIIHTTSSDARCDGQYQPYTA